MPYVCGLDCNLLRNNSQISEKLLVSRIFVGRKNKIPLKKILYAGPFGQMKWLVPENLILFFVGGLTLTLKEPVTIAEDNILKYIYSAGVGKEDYLLIIMG